MVHLFSLQTLRNLSPALKGLLFAIIPLIYYLADKLNYSQAGLAAVLGFFTLTSLFYWRRIMPQRRVLFDQLLLASLIIIVLNIAFQAVLRDVFGVQQDDVIVVQAIFSTDMNETTEFFIQYARYIALHTLFFLLALTGYWYAFVRQGVDNTRPHKPRKHEIWKASAVTFLLVAIHFNPATRRADPLYYFPYYYTRWQADIAETEQLQQQLKANKSDPILNAMRLANNAGPRTVVLVIGESDTRNNWSLYGYPRQTTPRLDKLKDQLVVFRNTISGDCSTIGSITKMLTPATMDQPDLWKSKPSIVPMAQQLGYKVFWVTNQGAAGHGIVSSLAAQADVSTFTNKGGSRLESTHDEAVFAPYQQALNDPAERKLIVVHILGAHPSYNYRYPERFGVFEDVFDDPVAEQLAAGGRTLWGIGFRNMYDSAIHYEDYVLSETLTRLMNAKAINASWTYIADHGQDVAHHNDFSGHHITTREQWEVPMLHWRSKSLEIKSLDQSKLGARPYQADVLDHVILGQLGAQGQYYDPRLDILSAEFDQKLQLPRDLRGIKYD